MRPSGSMAMGGSAVRPLATPKKMSSMDNPGEGSHSRNSLTANANANAKKRGSVQVGGATTITPMPLPLVSLSAGQPVVPKRPGGGSQPQFGAASSSSKETPQPEKPNANKFVEKAATSASTSSLNKS